MTVALDLPMTTSRLRVVPAPACAPPYDDEVGERPVLLLVPRSVEPFELDETAWFTDDRTPTADLPDARAFTHALLQALIEVYAGARPLTQLRMRLSMDLYAELARELHGGRRAPGGRPEPRSVLAVHVQARPEGVAEACATVRRAGRLGAVAVRLEGFGDRWVCTDVEGL